MNTINATHSLTLCKNLEVIQESEKSLSFSCASREMHQVVGITGRNKISISLSLSERK